MAVARRITKLDGGSSAYASRPRPTNRPVDRHLRVRSLELILILVFAALDSGKKTLWRVAKAERVRYRA